MEVRSWPASPLAFPQNPYHPLIKHYKDDTLLREAESDPVADALLAARAFGLEWDEFARLGAGKVEPALRFVAAYFSMEKAAFVREYFAGRREILERTTTQESYRQIVDSLANPAQTSIVAAPPDDNLLVLAGPGAGKTRVVVHRVAATPTPGAGGAGDRHRPAAS